MARPRKIDTTEVKIGQDQVRTLPSEGEAVLSEIEVVPVDGPNIKAKTETLAFMEEPVTIMLTPTVDKNAEKVIPVWNDGRIELFERGKAKVTKRKYVEVLARCKETAYGQEEFVNADGVRNIRYPSTNALRYPFTVIEDRNPNGSAWLLKILQEGA